MGEQTWNFGEIAQGSAELDAENMKISGLLDQERAELKVISGFWEGDAKEAWHAQQREWQEKADNLREALNELCQLARDATGQMQATEKEIGGMFE